MPKLIVNSTGDQFFLPDGIQFHHQQIPGENHLYYAPNTEHGPGVDLEHRDPVFSLINFVRSFYSGGPARPRYSWSLPITASLILPALWICFLFALRRRWRQRTDWGAPAEFGMSAALMVLRAVARKN